ncbi:MAG: NAD(P)-binding domain-containing protein, partial [Desulfobacterales bacterium]
MWFLEKGDKLMQGIVDSYPPGKKVYPSIPKGESGPFLVKDQAPDQGNAPVEEYLEKVDTTIVKHGVSVQFNEDFQNIKQEGSGFTVITRHNSFRAANVVLAFGSNIPVDLGVYGEAKTV